MISSRLELKIFALGLLILLSNSFAESKTYNLDIQDRNPIDLCGKEFQKQVIIAPYMGDIIESDNLIGFEISLNYDPEIVSMNQKLFINTVSNYFEHKNIIFDVERKEIVFDGIASIKGNPNPISVDLPLFAVAGDFIGDCDDEALFTVNYIYFPEFKGEIEVQDGITIKGDIVDKPTREISFKVLETERLIKKDSSLTVEVELKLGELNSLEFWKTEISIDTDSLDIDNITGSSSIEILEVTKSEEDGYLVDFRVIDNENPKLLIELTSHKTDSSIVNIDLTTIETTECICATRFPSSSFNIINLETKVEDTNTTNIEYYSDSYEIVNGNIIATKNSVDIEVFNINGVLLEKKYCNINQVYNTKQNKLGMYFIKITSDNRTKIIKQINN